MPNQDAFTPSDAHDGSLGLTTEKQEAEVAALWEIIERRLTTAEKEMDRLLARRGIN